jgi:hypothetical protein
MRKSPLNRIVNSTADYYLDDIETLVWELSICNTLYSENSRCRKILTSDDSYGNLLYDYLSSFMPMEKIEHISAGNSRFDKVRDEQGGYFSMGPVNTSNRYPPQILVYLF